MSENEPNLGSEESNDRPDFAAPPAAAGEMGEGTQAQPAPSPWAQPGPASAAGPVPTGPVPPAAATAPEVPQPPAAQPNPFAAPDPGQASDHPAGPPPGLTWQLQTTPLGAPVVGTAQPVQPSKTPSWRRVTLAAVAAAAIAVTAGGVGGVVGYALHDSGSGLQITNAGSKNAAPVVDRSSLATIAASIQPDVVSIKTSAGEGSGVVISADGYIVTNNHVVESATNSTVTVTFNSGKQVDARIVGTDPKTDLAVVRVGGVSGLRFAQFGDSDNVQVGDTVLAIGSPLGLQGSVTAGIISALHRTITVGGEQQSRFTAPTPQTTIGDAIQTDAPINPGNSGGALVDTNGRIVGINSAIATSGSSSSGNIGVGFAIPSNKVKVVAQALISGAKVSHPYLGVSVGDAQNGGALIQSVAANSPAAKAGLQAGDVVTKIGDRNVATSEDLVGAVQASSVGSTLTLTVVRNGNTHTVTATVAETP